MESFETALKSLGTYRDITRELARWVLSLSPNEQTFLLVAKDFALERDPPLVWAKAIYSALFQTGPSWETVEDSLAGIVVRRPCDPIITEIYEDDYGTDMPPDVREDIKWVPSFSHPVYLEAIHLAADENADLNGRYCDLLRTYAEYQDTILHDRATTEIIRAFALERLFWYGACQRLPFVSIPAEPSLYLTKTYAERDNIPLQVTTFANLVFLMDIAGPKTREILRELWNTTIRGAGARLIEDFSVSPDSLSIETDSDNFYFEITKEQYEAIVAVLELPVDDEGTYDWRRDGHSW